MMTTATAALHGGYHDLRKKTPLATPPSINVTFNGGDVTKTPRGQGQKVASPLPANRLTPSSANIVGGGASEGRGLRVVHTAESSLSNTSVAVSSGGTDDSRTGVTLDTSTVTTGDSRDTSMADSGMTMHVSGAEEDGVDGGADMAAKVAHKLAHIETMKTAIKAKIEAEQRVKEENVSDYLTLSSAAEGTDAQHRIKAQFEKRNQKSALAIAHLQQKLARYEAREAALQAGEVPTDRRRQAKAVLRDMGHGLRGMVANVRGAKDTIVAKPKELASIFKNRFGSADDIREAATSDLNQSTAEKASTLPSTTKLGSDDDSSSLTSGSAPGVLPLPTSGSCHGSNSSQHAHSNNQPGSDGHLSGDLGPVHAELQRHHETLTLLWKNFDNFKSQQQAALDKLRTSMRLNQESYEMLDSHFVELAEMRQSDLNNLNEDIRNMEERMEYHLEERMRDVHELLENCQNRISKMERTQQQAQQNSVDMLENSNARTIFTKLLNVVLALLAVILVLISTFVNVGGPCLKTRLRLVMTVFLAVVFVLTYYRWTQVEELCHHAITGISHRLSFSSY